MVAPHTLVRHVHPFLALAARGQNGSIGVDPRRRADERLWLLSPDGGAHVIDDVHQPPDRFGVESPTVVAGRGGVWNRSRIQSVEEGCIVAADFDVVYRLEIPDTANFRDATPVPYIEDNSASVSGCIERIAYYLELDSGSGLEWVYVSMDPFTLDATEIGLPQTEIPTALLFFNVGVEIGQIAFVIAAVALFFAGKSVLPVWRGMTFHQVLSWTQRPAAYVVGVLALNMEDGALHRILGPRTTSWLPAGTAEPTYRVPRLTPVPEMAMSWPCARDYPIKITSLCNSIQRAFTVPDVS